jgi:hypothetical protein
MQWSLSVVSTPGVHSGSVPVPSSSSSVLRLLIQPSLPEDILKLNEVYSRMEVAVAVASICNVVQQHWQVLLRLC